ncbi:MAG: 30S ribosomal protein S2 [Minisyncoccia bacterium]
MEEKNQNNKDLIKEFLVNGCHYGRAKRFTHPLMKVFLVKNNKKNVEIFDVNKTIEKLNEAANYLSDAIKDKKIILFVGAKPAAEKPIQKIGEEFNMPYLNYKWVGGFLTNFETIKTRLIYLKELLEKEKTNELENYPPQDKQRILKELDKMKKIYGGAISLENLPDIIFIVDLNFKSHKTAVREAFKKEIPIVGICGSDNNPSGVKVVIPANDKAPRSINFLIDYLINKIKEKLQSNE